VIDQLSLSRKRVTPFAEQITSGKVQVFSSSDQVFTSADQVFTSADQVFTSADQVFTTNDELFVFGKRLFAFVDQHSRESREVFDFLKRTVAKNQIPSVAKTRGSVSETRSMPKISQFRRDGSNTCSTKVKNCSFETKKCPLEVEKERSKPGVRFRCPRA
jgi:hypothetical protein